MNMPGTDEFLLVGTIRKCIRTPSSVNQLKFPLPLGAKKKKKANQHNSMFRAISVRWWAFLLLVCAQGCCCPASLGKLFCYDHFLYRYLFSFHCIPSFSYKCVATINDPVLKFHFVICLLVCPCWRSKGTYQNKIGVWVYKGIGNTAMQRTWRMEFGQDWVKFGWRISPAA